MPVLAAAVRFLHFALFQEELLSIHYYLVTFVILLAVAWLGYRSCGPTQMATAIFLGLRKGRSQLAAALARIGERRLGGGVQESGLASRMRRTFIKR